MRVFWISIFLLVVGCVDTSEPNPCEIAKREYGVLRMEMVQHMEEWMRLDEYEHKHVSFEDWMHNDPKRRYHNMKEYWELNASCLQDL